MWVLIDNYDSFTHILHHYLLQTGHDCTVYRNDALSLEALIQLAPTGLIISPGPGTPVDAGITMAAIAHFHDKIPILGICLGFQALGMFFGASLVHAPQPRHGKTSIIAHNGHRIFKDVPNPFTAMRYHSLAINNTEHSPVQVIATSNDDATIMGIAHATLPCIGLQFHPESIGTPDGLKMLQNWAELFNTPAL